MTPAMILSIICDKTLSFQIEAWTCVVNFYSIFRLYLDLTFIFFISLC